MSSHLPTLVSANWTVTALHDSLVRTLAVDKQGTEIQLFFYAVTESGWRTIRRDLRLWLTKNEKRRILAYVGTDHAITEAEAIRLMVEDDVTVRLMTSYRGVFHPKVIWLRSPEGNTVWIGSNNLTRDGLLNNIEFAALIESDVVPRDLHRWSKAVHGGSAEYSEGLLAEYERERTQYGERRVSLGTFTWTRREQAQAPIKRRKFLKPRKLRSSGEIQSGDLIVEVMPRETGPGGKQIQLPMRAATAFFGLADEIGARRIIHLTPAWLDDPRELTMTIFRNHTVRLVIKELDYRDRPCVLLFKRMRNGTISFDIISRGVFPSQYRELLEQCGLPTREGSRRWVLVD